MSEVQRDALNALPESPAAKGPVISSVRTGASVRVRDAARRSAMGSGRPESPSSQSALMPSAAAQSAASWALGSRVPGASSADRVERSTPSRRASAA